MFLVGSFVKITDISECKKVELNEVFKVLSSSKSTTVIENKDGINLGGYYSWRFVAADPAVDATKTNATTVTDDDWFYFDVSKHAGHVLRRNIDQLKSKNENTDWTSVSLCANTKICLEDINKYEFRCKKSDTPKEFTTNAPKPPEDDWIELDETIYADHILRENIDECKSKINLRSGWERVSGLRNKKLSVYAETYNFRCKRSVLPVADATKSQAVDTTKSPETEPKNSAQFCVGQEIICNEKGLSLLTYNKAYTVLEANTLSSEFYVKVKDDKGVISQFLQSRFRVTDVTKSQVADATESQAADPAITNLCAEVEQPLVAKKDTKIIQQDKKMFKNKFHDGQTVICEEYDSGKKKLTVGKKYIVISNDPTNNGGGVDMIRLINNFGDKEWFFVHRFSAAIAENVATAESTTVAANQPKRIVAKVTNNYLTRGQSYEVVGYYIPAAESFKVKLGDNGYALSFRSDCFESDISLSDVTNVDGVTGTKENEMKKETAVKVASVVGKFAAGWGFRALNYWAIEPAVNIARPILSSVRYAGFLAAISMIGYGMYNPQAVKDAAYSCIPKISFSIEAPEILNGK